MAAATRLDRWQDVNRAWGGGWVEGTSPCAHIARSDVLIAASQALLLNHCNHRNHQNACLLLAGVFSHAIGRD